MQNETDAHLLVQLKQGHKAALQAVFEARYSEVCRAIFRLVPNQSTMQDLAQEVFVKLWEKREQIVINSSLATYLRRMAVNEALMYLRRQRFFEGEDSLAALPTDGDHLAETLMLHHDLQDTLQQALRALPPRCRLVFQLSRFEGMTYREIADYTGTSLKTVENQMGKVLKILRKLLAEFLS